MTSLIPNKKVKDIAALFGEQITVKKTKSRAKSKSRRNSETLQQKKRNLRNVKPTQIDTNAIPKIFGVALKSPKSHNDETPQRGETEDATINNDGTNSDIDIDDLDHTPLDIDEFMRKTYGGWTQWSHSSYLSTIDCSTFEYADDARSSVCADDETDKRQTDIDHEDIHQHTMDTNTNHSIPSDDDDDDGGEMMERLKHLDDIGATRTRGYLLKQMSSTTTSTDGADDTCTVNLFGADEDYIESDDSDDPKTDECVGCNIRESVSELDRIALDLDLVVTDEDETTEEEYRTRRTVSELLIQFGIYAFNDVNIYNYFRLTLGVRYCCELVDILPINVGQPMHYSDCNCNIRTLMKLNKMCIFISRGVIGGVWNGLRSKEWMQLEDNCVHTVFQYASNVMSNYQDYQDFVCNDSYNYDKDSMRLQLNGFEKKYFCRFAANKLKSGQEIVFCVNVQQLPDKYRFEPKLFKIGVECSKESLYITDCLSIRRNENYVKSMFIGTFVENGSEMFLRLRRDDDDSDYLNINLCHDPKGQYTRFEHKTFSNTFKMKIKEKKRIKLFIEQYKGVGIYITKN